MGVSVLTFLKTPIMPNKKLCSTSELDRTDAKSLSIEIDGVITDLFLVRNNAGIYCYIDHCPHLGSPLAWQPDQYLDSDKKHIVCATHAALFKIDSGYCVAGPCVDQSLTQLTIAIIDNEVVLLGDKNEI